MSITSLVVFLIILGFGDDAPSTVIEFHNMQSCKAALVALETQRRVTYAGPIKNGWEVKPLAAVCAPQNIETQP